ncbi:MAG: phosphatase PAP2 family protein [Promethearchaeota archaeon]|nr:MAG: phosphatase PAP2 family protein [Candidatus Lokiarchaeota archaeon]
MRRRKRRIQGSWRKEKTDINAEVYLMREHNIVEWGFILFFIVVICLAVLMLIGEGDLLLGDQQAFMLLNPGQGNPTPFDEPFVFMATWGPWNLGWGLYIPWSLVLFGLVLSWKLTALRPMRVAILIIVLATLVGVLGVNSILTSLFIRERPFMDPMLLSNAPDLFSYPEMIFWTQSFPSNHATAGFIIAGSVMVVYRSYAAKAFALAYGMLNAYSRVYTGIHYPLDILVGAIIALSITLLCFLPLRKYLRRMQLKSDLEALEGY